MHIFQLFSPSWSREGWLLLLSLLGLLLVVLLLDRLTLGVKWLWLWILTDRVVQEELKGLTCYNIIVHFAAQIVGSQHVLILNLPVLSLLDQVLKLLYGVLGSS